jgi:hypothetical protein
MQAVKSSLRCLALQLRVGLLMVADQMRAAMRPPLF